jgi:hypothetical protein
MEEEKNSKLCVMVQSQMILPSSWIYATYYFSNMFYDLKTPLNSAEFNKARKVPFGILP